MKPLSIFLIRHGESQGNVNKEIYKTIPDWKIDLTEKGMLQSREAGKKLALLIKQNYNIYKNNVVTFYCSPWYRTRQTYKGIHSTLSECYPTLNFKYKEDPRIREQEWGNYQEEHFIRKINEERKNFGTFFYRMPHGESGADVYDRITTFIDTLYRDFDEENSSANMVIISHGLAIKAFLMRWYHWDVEEFDRLDTPDNCGIIQMDLQENNRYKLITELKRNPDL